MTDRQLTPLLKAQTLERWEETKADFERQRQAGTLPAVTGGLGYPDPEVYELCDRLNRIDGIVTVQSCSGHCHEGEEVSLWSGQLWIRLNTAMRNAYVTWAPELLETKQIERAGLLFSHDDGDVADIIFAGLNVDQDTLSASAEAIVQFFTTLADCAEPTCRECGCTDDHACDGGCCWVEEDLCSSCVEVESRA